MMIETSSDGELFGLTSDIIATVSAESRRSDKSGIGFVSNDGDETMKIALNEAVRAVTLQDVIALARKDRDPKLAEAIKLFAGLQSQLAKNEKAALADPNTKTTLNKVLELAPNHLSAKYLLALAEGRAAKTLSLQGSLFRLDTILYPYYRALASDRPLNRTSLSAATTMNARKKLNADLRPIANKDLMPLLVDVAAFIEAMDQFAENPKRNSLENLKTRAGNLDARFAQVAGDKDLRANLRREGY